VLPPAIVAVMAMVAVLALMAIVPAPVAPMNLLDGARRVARKTGEGGSCGRCLRRHDAQTQRDNTQQASSQHSARHGVSFLVSCRSLERWCLSGIA
jgi:hypothetical protein